MSENPSVNRCLNDKALDYIDHALGRPAWPLRESYRNYFAIQPNRDLAREFEASPHWKRDGRVGRLICFRVTDEGRKALADHLAALRLDSVFVVTFEGHDRIVPAATPSKARYSHFLDVSDVVPDLTFGDFLCRSRVRRAA